MSEGTDQCHKVPFSKKATCRFVDVVVNVFGGSHAFVCIEKLSPCARDVLKSHVRAFLFMFDRERHVFRVFDRSVGGIKCKTYWRYERLYNRKGRMWKSIHLLRISHFGFRGALAGTSMVTP